MCEKCENVKPKDNFLRTLQFASALHSLPDLVLWLLNYIFIISQQSPIFSKTGLITSLYALCPTNDRFSLQLLLLLQIAWVPRGHSACLPLFHWWSKSLPIFRLAGRQKRLQECKNHHEFSGRLILKPKEDSPKKADQSVKKQISNPRGSQGSRNQNINPNQTHSREQNTKTHWNTWI